MTVRTRASSGPRALPSRRASTLALVVAAATAGASFVLSCRDEAGSAVAPPGSTKAGASAAPTFVDPGACYGCHAEMRDAWEDSHHALAMLPADADSVLGDFDDAEFEHFGVRTRFFRRGDEFLVETDGPDGRPTEYAIQYTFGVDPLQQYLIDVGRGRLQALQVAWDTAAGRWFHLYDEPIPPDDPLHWTGLQFNWNHMCAECHSTDLDKGYDASTDTFDTTWHEVNVGCQACHGPGSAHVAWAEEAFATEAAYSDDDPKGLVAQLDGPASHVQVETCARCHARRADVTGDWQHGDRFLDHYDLALLTDPLYHADGQILDEVYVYGSFLQAKKYAHGVRCSDCHDPHSARLLAEGNALCVRCHSSAPPAEYPTIVPQVYDGPEHHHHPVDENGGGPGTACVDCHMPSTDYMVVDPRRDHGFKVPRPDLTERIGVPNACSGCHADRDAAWAAERIAEWRGPDAPAPAKHWGETLAAARASDPRSVPELVRIAGDPELPGIVRATALHEMARFGDPRVLAAAEGALEDPDALVRRAAIEVFEIVPTNAPPAYLAQVGNALAPRLEDEIRLVRTEAARVLGPFPVAIVGPERVDALRAASLEYVERQLAISDRPEGAMNLAVLSDLRGTADEAEKLYRQALKIDPNFAPARFNLANMLNAQGRNDEAEAQLAAVLERQPQNGEAHYSLGLLLAELSRWVESVEHLEAAVRLLPDRARMRFNLALALRELERDEEALVELSAAERLDPQDPQIVHARAELHADRQEWSEVRAAAARLAELAPGAPVIEDLLRRAADAGQ